MAALREGLERFPQELALRVTLASALKVGRREEALAELDEIGRRFPGDRRTPPLTVQAAEERSLWARALEIWDDYVVRFDAAGEPQAVVGRARALFRLDRVDEAAAELEALLAREPDNALASRELAAICFELGEAERVRDLRVRLMQGHAKSAKPEWWAALARSHHDLREHAAGAAALAELERRFPNSPARRDRAAAARQGPRARPRRAEGADRGGAGALSAGFRPARALGLEILLSLGRLEDAECEVEALRAKRRAVHALTTRLGSKPIAATKASPVFSRAGARAGLHRRRGDTLGYQLIEIRTSWASKPGADRRRGLGARAGETPGSSSCASATLRPSMKAIRRGLLKPPRRI